MADIEEFKKLGFDHNIAEALAERGVGVGEVKILSAREVLEHFLEWNGIIGWTETIVEAILNIKKAKGTPGWLNNVGDF